MGAKERKAMIAALQPAIDKATEAAEALESALQAIASAVEDLAADAEETVEGWRGHFDSKADDLEAQYSDLQRHKEAPDSEMDTVKEWLEQLDSALGELQ